MLLAHNLPLAVDVPPVSAPKNGKPKKQKRNSVIVGGIRYPLLLQGNCWRIRKRTHDVSVDISLGPISLDDAIAKAKEQLGKDYEHKTRLRNGRATLREVCDIYRAMPKRCSEDTAKDNVNRLKRIVEVGWGATLEDVTAGQFSARPPWEAYAKKRQGLDKLDLNTRRHENRGINAAMLMAVSIFHEGLEDGYKRAGITLDFPAIRRVPWLPVIPSKLPKLAQESIDALMAALPVLKAENRPMWRAVMIARFAGLRSKEVSGARKSWLVKNSAGAWCFEVRDRPEDQWWHKTGEDYTAPILSPELVEDLLACPEDGFLVPVTGSRDYFFVIRCNKWLRKFIPLPNKGMHRLRALYAEALRDATANAVLAQQAGLEAAQKALGHTSSKTTEGHYLPG